MKHVAGKEYICSVGNGGAVYLGLDYNATMTVTFQAYHMSALQDRVWRMSHLITPMSHSSVMRL